MKYMLIIIVFLSMAACGIKKHSDKNEQKGKIKTTETAQKKQDSIKEDIESREISQTTPDKSKNIIQTDSTYIIQFYNEDGKVVRDYDIWENNPLEFDFEKYDETPGEHPMRYKVPALTKDQLIGSVPDELMKNLDSGVHIGRIDVHPRVSKKEENFMVLLYHVEAKEGFDEEYTGPSSMGVVQVLNNKGELIKQIQFPNSSLWKPVLTQDGKYLVYHTFFKKMHPGECYNVYDMSKGEKIFQTCIEKGFEFNGAVLINDHLIAALVVDRIGEESIMHYINSKEEVLYKKTLPINRYNYYPNYLNNGVVLIDRKSKTADTLLYDRDFEVINLKK
jgi:hypothetical protein